VIDPSDWIGDKGYVGLGMITPIKKPPHRDLLDWEKEFNTAINRIRWKTEQTIAKLKTWRILHSDSRRSLETLPLSRPRPPTRGAPRRQWPPR